MASNSKWLVFDTSFLICAQRILRMLSLLLTGIASTITRACPTNWPVIELVVQTLYL
jgi:hypothetical protein